MGRGLIRFGLVCSLQGSEPASLLRQHQAASGSHCGASLGLAYSLGNVIPNVMCLPDQHYCRYSPKPINAPLKQNNKAAGVAASGLPAHNKKESVHFFPPIERLLLSSSSLLARVCADTWGSFRTHHLWLRRRFLRSTPLHLEKTLFTFVTHFIPSPGSLNPTAIMSDKLTRYVSPELWL